MTKQWDRYRAEILDYYQKQRMPLTKVMKLMEEQYNLKASQRAYRQRFSIWGISKYNRKSRRRDTPGPPFDFLTNTKPDTAYATAGAARSGRLRHPVDRLLSPADTPRPGLSKPAQGLEIAQGFQLMSPPYSTTGPARTLGFTSGPVGACAAPLASRPHRDGYSEIDYLNHRYGAQDSKASFSVASLVESSGTQSTVGQESPSSFLLAGPDGRSFSMAWPQPAQNPQRRPPQRPLLSPRDSHPSPYPPLDEPCTGGRTMPLSPLSLPDSILHSPVNRGQPLMQGRAAGPIYSSDPMAAAMDFHGRSYDANFASSFGPCHSAHSASMPSPLSTSSMASAQRFQPLSRALCGPEQLCLT